MSDTIEKFNGAVSSFPEATEVFSGPYLIDGKNSELFSNLKQTFPKVGAVEMEAGAVAQAVLHSVETERFVGYLIIKGISDVIDSDVPADKRKAVRKAISPYASIASVEFARHMISKWTGNTAQPFGHLALVPPKYLAKISMEFGNRRNSNSLVYEEVTLDRYSRLLQHICSSEEDITSAWTFCYLAPFRFFASIDGGHEVNNLSRDELIEAAINTLERYKDNKKALHQKLLEEFPHFRVFLDLAQKANKDVVRVLHRGAAWSVENGYFLEDFSRVNEGLQCYVLSDSDLEGEDWVRKDQVIINDEILFDFDPDNHRLIITYLDREGLGAESKRFRDHCARRGEGRRFEAMAPVIIAEFKSAIRNGHSRQKPRRK